MALRSCNMNKIVNFYEKINVVNYALIYQAVSMLIGINDFLLRPIKDVTLVTETMK